MNFAKPLLETALCASFILLTACTGVTGSTSSPQTIATTAKGINSLRREAKIPSDAVKVTVETDPHPLTLNSDEFEIPLPIPGKVNTAGAEDSPFITPDGKTLYFFFTPDVRVPAEEQILDGVTGIYVSHQVNGEWSTAQRVILEGSGKLSLDGCEYVRGNVIWFCSTRQGYTGIHWFTAQFHDGSWQDWQLADFPPEYQVGELHFSLDGTALYFGSQRPGGKGGLDIWMSKLVDSAWQQPVDISKVNTADDEGWPALNPAGDELWFTRNYGVWRSKKVDGEWQAAELIVSPLAGEPSIDQFGNLYFVHHYYLDDRMIEADIYVAYRK